MRLIVAKLSLFSFALISMNAFADEPARSFKFEFSMAQGSGVNGADLMQLMKQRCVENQLGTSEEALARIDWADRCGYISKSKWWPIYSLNYDPFSRTESPRAKLAYPIFVQGSENKPWIPNISACDMPEDVKFLTVCEAGCYTADQKLMFTSGVSAVGIPIAHAKDSWTKDVNATLQSGSKEFPEEILKIYGLTEGSTFESIKMKPLNIRRFLVSAMDEKNSILEFKTALGGTLKVTPDHPLVNAQGLIRKASFFKPGDELVRQDGSLDAIVSISQKVIFGKVYNVEPSSSKGTEHIHIAQGFLAGSLALQNGDMKDIDRIMSRKGSDSLLLKLK